MKNVAILGAYSPDDTWNITLSFFNHFNKLGYNAKLYSTQVNHEWNDLNLKQLVLDYRQGEFVPDIVFHLDFGFFNSELLHKKYIPEAKWIVESGDDPQNFRLNFPKIQKGNFDLILSPDIRCTEFYVNKGINAAWCPHFADPDQFDVTQEPLYDAVTTRSVEEPFFKQLKQLLGPRFEARLDFLEGKDHSVHLLKGRTVIQNSKHKEVTRRVFEGMMANRLVITDRPDPAARMDLIFTENKDIVYFDDVDNCVEKINYYTANQQELEQIASSGYKKVSNFHTTSARIKKILSLV